MAMDKKYVRYTTLKSFPDDDYEITQKVNIIYNTEIDRSRKDIPSISSARSSVRRAHKNLFDVLRANKWQYFCTLTFGFDGLDADEKCRAAFSKWAKEVKRKFPQMYYVAVPEYHKKGDLHYHVVVGGVSADDLKLHYSGRVLHKGKNWKEEDFYRRGFTDDPATGEGARVYNINSWDNGFSTATEIRDTNAVARYVSKYLAKSDIDPRFYNKRRFHTSHNVGKPVVLKSVDEDTFNMDASEGLGLLVRQRGDSFNVSDIDPLTLVQRGYDFTEIPRIKFSKVQKMALSQEEIIKLRLKGVLPMPSHEV